MMEAILDISSVNMTDVTNSYAINDLDRMLDSTYKMEPSSDNQNENLTYNNTNITNATILLMAPYFSMPYQVVGCLFVSLIFIIGLVGNVMVVIVVSRTRSMHTTTNCYLVSLAIADVLLLISAPLPTVIEFFTIIDQFILGPIGCALMVFTQYLGINVSSLSITAFTIERYIAICHPMKAQTMCTVKRAKRIIFGLWVFGLCYCSPWLALTKIRTKYFQNNITIQRCTYKLERNSYLTYYMADLVIFYVIPLLLTCVLYGLIARILVTSSLIATPRNACSTNGNAKAAKKSASSSRIQVIKMLAIVVGMFAILWMPYRIYVVYNSFAKNKYQDYWFLLFVRVMVYMNSAINPILYNAMSVKFRRAFKRLLYCADEAEQKQHDYIAFRLMLANSNWNLDTTMTGISRRSSATISHSNLRTLLDDKDKQVQSGSTPSMNYLQVPNARRYGSSPNVKGAHFMNSIL